MVGPPTATSELVLDALIDELALAIVLVAGVLGVANDGLAGHDRRRADQLFALKGGQKYIAFPVNLSTCQPSGR